jgi:hypothetical protein
MKMHPDRITENEISVSFYTACWLFTQYNLIRVELLPSGKSRYVFPYNEHVERLLREKQSSDILEVYINTLIRFKRKLRLDSQNHWGAIPQKANDSTNDNIEEEFYYERQN